MAALSAILLVALGIVVFVVLDWKRGRRIVAQGASSATRRIGSGWFGVGGRPSDLFVHRGVPEHIRSDSRESSQPSASGSGWEELG